MKRSRKIINILYIVIILALIIVAGLIVHATNKAEWDARESEVWQNGELAMDTFYSYTTLKTAPLTEKEEDNLGMRIQQIPGEHTSSVRITHTESKENEDDAKNQLPEDNQLAARFISNEAGGTEMELICGVEFMGDSYRTILHYDFSDLTREHLSRWRIYAICAVLVLLLGGALLLFLNLLWIEADKNKQFMENFTHELKTPMTTILGYSQMMQNDSLTPEEQDGALKAITFEANRLNNLSQQMLNIFLAQNEKPELSQVDMGLIEEEIKIPLTGLSEKHQVPYTLQMDEATVTCNKDLLYLLISNLADNAMKATVNAKRTFPVLIRGEAKESGYRISVTDHGTGISKKNISRITEPFFREDKARSRAQGGAGLGLTLCQEIAKLHGSNLAISSRKGVGTKVVFELAGGVR